MAERSNFISVTCNISNKSGDININPTDNLILTEKEKALFESKKSKVENIDDKEKIIDANEGMQNAVDEKDHFQKCNAFMQAVANHIDIFKSFIQLLIKFFVN